MTALKPPVPNGMRPVAANATVAAHACTSDAGDACWSSKISGAMYPGVPVSMPVWVRGAESDDRAIPKSMTTGSPFTSIVLLGLRSR